MQQFLFDRLRSAGKAQGFDCLAASSAENIAYITGGYTSIGQSVSASTQLYAVLSLTDGRLSYAAPAAEVPGILEYAGLDAEIYPYGPFHFDFEASEEPFVQAARRICASRYPTGEEALCAAVRAAGTAPGFDETHINFALAGRIASGLGVQELTPASGVFREARRVKHPQEIQLLRESAQIAEASLLEALDGIGPGITEEDLQRRYRRAVTARGASPYFFVATAAQRAAFVDARNTALSVRPGDMIRFDFGCIWKGAYSDLARTAVMGYAGPDTERAYRAVEAGAKEALSLLRPGVTAESVFSAAVEAVRAGGLPAYARTHCGHGIGLEGYDVPSIAAGVQDRIEEGMVLCIETPYYRVGWGGVQIEHTVAVTRDGFKFLDSGDSSLIVIPV